MAYCYATTNKRKVKCKVCGKLFTTYHPAQKTCSLECSMQNKADYRKEQVKIHKRYKKTGNVK